MVDTRNESLLQFGLFIYIVNLDMGGWGRNNRTYLKNFFLPMLMGKYSTILISNQ